MSRRDRFAIRVQFVMGGEQDTRVSLTGPSGAPCVIVRTGALLIYCQHRAVVYAHAAAWTQALIEATTFYPVGWSDTPLGSREAISVVIRQDAPPAYVLAKYPARDSRTQRPYLELTLGPVLNICRDLAAVQSVRTAWQDAVTVAEVAWPSRRPTHHPQYPQHP